MSASEAFEEKVERLVEEAKNGAKEDEIRRAEKQALHKAIDEQLQQRECRMTEAIHQGDIGKLWDLITAAVGNGFIYHLGLNAKVRARYGAGML